MLGEPRFGFALLADDVISSIVFPLDLTLVTPLQLPQVGRPYFGNRRHRRTRVPLSAPASPIGFLVMGLECGGCNLIRLVAVPVGSGELPLGFIQFVGQAVVGLDPKVDHLNSLRVMFERALILIGL